MSAIHAIHASVQTQGPTSKADGLAGAHSATRQNTEDGGMGSDGYSAPHKDGSPKDTSPPIEGAVKPKRGPSGVPLPRAKPTLRTIGKIRISDAVWIQLSLHALQKMG